MKQNLTAERNDPRLCMAGTESLWSVCNRKECGNITVTDVIAENIEHHDALLFAAAPDLLEACIRALEAIKGHNERQTNLGDCLIEEACGLVDAIAKAKGGA